MNTDDPAPAEPPEGPAPEPRDHQHRQHGYRGRFERSMDTVTRDAQAAELRSQGRTYQQIADELGMSNKGDAWRAVQRAKADVARPAVTKLVQTESEQLDELYVMAMEVIERNHITVSHGKIVCGQDGTPLQDDGPRLQAIQAALRIRESYRKLHGLDQPTQVAVSGAVRYEVVGVDTADLT
ncbi:hypothetical protein ACFU96_21735 [Streptomyces sp. NPDC057620]|uniref:hypothetical protein n=1 Tax=Streptomyces sp. NPDC057620 TaxID=3346185 RepID=UPI00367E66AC